MNRYLGFFIVGLLSGWTWGFFDGLKVAVGSA
jgi:hypothetical protein